jgi:parvulin-like peptidyl-prolyl isomerase
MKLFPAVFLAVAVAAALRTEAGASTANSDSAGVSTDPVVARGKGFEIKRRAMDQVLATARVNDPNHPLPPDAESHVLAQLIEIQLVLQKATDAEKEEGRRRNDVNFTAIVKNMGEQKFERHLKETLMTPDDLRLMLFQEDVAQASLTRQLGIHVTDADARKYFEDNPGAFDEPEKARIREVVLLTTSDFSTSAAPPLPAATIRAKRQQIDGLLKRVRAGEDFAALAKKYNEDPVAEGAGELTFSRDQMEFGDLAFSMKPGQISEVLTNAEGFRFFQLLEIIPAKKGEFAALAGKLKTMLTGAQKQERAPGYIKQLRKEAAIEILDPKLKAEAAAAEAQMAENAKAQAANNAAHAEGSNSPTAKP